MEDVDVAGGLLNLRGTDVPQMMTRVETTLSRAARSPEGAVGVMRLAAEGDDDFPIAYLRTGADIQVEFPSGSARPVIGPAVRFLKRYVRRGLRWYVAPIIAEQSRFNHSVLDLIERLRVQQEHLAAEVEGLREELAQGLGAGPEVPGTRESEPA